MKTLTLEWVREIQRQARAKNKPYLVSEVSQLADSAHIWSMHYGHWYRHADCLEAAKAVLAK